jgi:iron complex transport system permease protein
MNLDPSFARGLRAGPLSLGFAALAAAALAGVVFGPADLPIDQVLLALFDRIPAASADHSLTSRQLGIVWELRLPRVVLGACVGATLSLCGAAYQGVFRNPLVDPYLLGVAAGAGLGATLAFVAGGASFVPIAAFAGAVIAVLITYAIGNRLGDRANTSLVLAGVAVASFLTAAQTFIQQRSSDDLRVVYSWILGRLSASWSDVRLVLPYMVVSAVVILIHRRLLDVLGVGDAEAQALGVPVRRVRILVVIAATLGTAAAVAVSGLIGFVGIIIPHTVRLIAGSSYRSTLPLSILFGASFMVITDLAARTLLAPAELPIGVVTAFFGAPFFLSLLRSKG